MTISYHIPQNSQFIGRQHEQALLHQIADGQEASIIITHGRRRIGKTELLEQTFRTRNIHKIDFNFMWFLTIFYD